MLKALPLTVELHNGAPQETEHSGISIHSPLRGWYRVQKPRDERWVDGDRVPDSLKLTCKGNDGFRIAPLRGEAGGKQRNVPGDAEKAARRGWYLS